VAGGGVTGLAGRALLAPAAAEGAADARGVGRIFVSTPKGYTIPVPDSFVARVADNGQGLVYQEAGAPGNTNMVRIMDPTVQYPEGYLRYYNAEGSGQPLDALGRPGARSATHIPLGGGPIPGYYSWLEQFVQ
jgi:hypothetical protein